MNRPNGNPVAPPPAIPPSPSSGTGQNVPLPVGPQAPPASTKGVLFYAVVILTSIAPQQCEGFQVPEGCQVQIAPIASNASVCFVARYRSALLGNSQGNILPVTQSFLLPFPVTNTAQIWVQGNATNGVIVMVTKGA